MAVAAAVDHRLLMSLVDLACQEPCATRLMFRVGLPLLTHATEHLGHACREAGVEASGFLATLDAMDHYSCVKWSAEPLAVLMDHLLGVHRRHREQMARIKTCLAQAAPAHPDANAVAVIQLVRRLTEDLEDHMRKEETVLFPWLRSGRGQSAGAPIRVMMADHSHVAEQLRTLRKSLPLRPSAQHEASWRPLQAEVQTFSEDLFEHVHLEDHILFPRALTGA